MPSSAAFVPPRVSRYVAMTRAMRTNLGVISVAQLDRLGFTRHDLEGLVAHGDLRRLHRGVYADGRAPLRDDAYFNAALLAVGSGAWLAGDTAAMALGLTPVSLTAIEVALVASSTPKHGGLSIRRMVHPPHPSEIRTLRGLRVSSVPRLLIEAAAGETTVERLHQLLEAAVRRHLLNVGDLAATLNRNAGRRGVPRVKAACAEYLPSPGRKSPLEQSFDRWLVTQPEIPQPQRNIRLGPWEIDCYWPTERLALELDGRAYHIAAHDFERDRLKDAWLQRNAIRILRVTNRRWRVDRAGVHRDLATMLGLRSERVAG
jgi:Transcriptional regulator, AbiEi antitoxin